MGIEINLTVYYKWHLLKDSHKLILLSISIIDDGIMPIKPMIKTREGEREKGSEQPLTMTMPNCTRFIR